MANETPKISMRLDPELRRAAQRVFGQMGLSLTAGITVYLKEVVRQGRIPFEVRGDEDGGGEDHKRRTPR